MSRVFSIDESQQVRDGLSPSRTRGASQCYGQDSTLLVDDALE